MIDHITLWICPYLKLDILIMMSEDVYEEHVGSGRVRG